jgi:hypothetical protein
MTPKVNSVSGGSPSQRASTGVLRRNRMIVTPTNGPYSPQRMKSCLISLSGSSMPWKAML